MIEFPKKITRRLLYFYSSRLGTSTLVASMGRSGSTLLCAACSKGMLGFDDHFFNQKISQQYLISAWELKKCSYSPGRVYKTHDYPDFSTPHHCRVLYTFSDPYEVVVSVYNQALKKGKAWFLEHLDHLKMPHNNLDTIFEKDVLGLENNFDSWLNYSRNRNIFGIRYDCIWQEKKRIEEFVGYKIYLPTYRKRESKLEELDHEKRERLIKTYSDLRDKILLYDTF